MREREVEREKVTYTIHIQTTIMPLILLSSVAKIDYGTQKYFSLVMIGYG